MNQTLVMKFGGASVASWESFSFIADIILQRKQSYKNIAVVVSAMGDTTDDLITLAHKVNPNPPRREFDMLVSVGERISISLLAMALAAKNCEAVSFTGSQSGIITTNENGNAKIIDVKPKRLLPCFEQGKIVIVAGFQGMSLSGDITTLGRGGSDTTAVALAAALQADKVEFFKDVDGVYDKDPKKNQDAKIFLNLNYESACQIMQAGAQILHSRCVLLAEKNNIPLHVLSFHKYLEYNTGTTICKPTSIKPNKPLYEGEE